MEGWLQQIELLKVASLQLIREMRKLRILWLVLLECRHLIPILFVLSFSMTIFAFSMKKIDLSDIKFEFDCITRCLYMSVGRNDKDVWCWAFVANQKWGS